MRFLKALTLASILVHSACSNAEPTTLDVASVEEPLTLSGITWPNIRTQTWGYQGVACLARAIVDPNRVKREEPAHGATHIVVTDWFGGEAYWVTTDERNISLNRYNAQGQVVETHMATYSLRSSSNGRLTIDYRSANGRTSTCYVEPSAGLGTWSGTF